MLCHLRSFSGAIWLNCSLSSAMSFALCSALRRNPAPPVTMLRLTAVPTRKCSLKASLRVGPWSAARTVVPMARSVAANQMVRADGVMVFLLRHELEHFAARVHDRVDPVGQHVEFAVVVFAQRPD